MSRLWDWLRHRPALVRAITYVLAVVLVSSPVVVPLYQHEYAATNGRSVIWAPLLLCAVFASCLPLWLRRVHRCSTPWAVLGLHGGWAWWRGWLTAFGAGAVGVMLLYSCQMFLGWGQWVNSSDTPLIRNLLEGLLVGIGVGLAEELIFRGWLLFELEQDYAAPVALWVNAGIFAIAHFLRPLAEIIKTWPQFVGLCLLGAALVWARRVPTKLIHQSRWTTTLGLATGLHGGLVFAYYQFDVNDWIVATDDVPAWVTGVGGNPLAGLLGLLFLSVIAYANYVASHPPYPLKSGVKKTFRRR
ncbi:MAG: CPBP family intramembrane glutamic endopeptidase [Cyanobacteria bacterium P01_A01_bin.70]